MRNLFIIAVLSIMVTICSQASQQCMVSSQCSGAEICLTDLNGRGICINKETAVRELSENISGMFGQKCSMPSDCNDGLICARPRGYLGYGVCQTDVKK